jgi:8-oxo-dGTP pyrophosphatase MutT (NUDIX family)
MIRQWTIIEREFKSISGLLQMEKKLVRSPRTNKEMEVHTFHSSPWTMVLPITAEQEVVMIRQYRHGTEAVSLELPGGLVESEDGTPDDGARRELLEETGYHSPSLLKLGECYPQPAILSNKCYFFLAEHAVKVRKPVLDDGEDIQVIKMPLMEIMSKIRHSEIDNGMVLLAFSLFWMKQKRLS